MMHTTGGHSGKIQKAAGMLPAAFWPTINMDTLPVTILYRNLAHGNVHHLISFLHLFTSPHGTNGGVSGKGSCVLQDTRYEAFVDRHGDSPPERRRTKIVRKQGRLHRGEGGECGKNSYFGLQFVRQWDEITPCEERWWIIVIFAIILIWCCCGNNNSNSCGCGCGNDDCCGNNNCCGGCCR